MTTNKPPAPTALATGRRDDTKEEPDVWLTTYH